MGPWGVLREKYQRLGGKRGGPERAALAARRLDGGYMLFKAIEIDWLERPGRPLRIKAVQSPGWLLPGPLTCTP